MSRQDRQTTTRLIADSKTRPVLSEELPPMPEHASRRAPTERSQAHKHDHLSRRERTPLLRRESPISDVSFVSLRLLEALTRREGSDAWTMENADRSLEMAVRVLRGQ